MKNEQKMDKKWIENRQKLDRNGQKLDRHQIEIIQKLDSRCIDNGQIMNRKLIEYKQ